ncbi:MAG TPA: MgtC/SapB family protein [Candidatus Paceibacterota bacterium]
METLIFPASNIGIAGQLITAMLLGMLVGAERAIAGKTAGMRTYALVSMGSALFTVISVGISAAYLGVVNFDPLRVAAGIITGIGFIGAGIIIFRESSLRGLTTAAGLWVAAGIGMAVGFKLYFIAVFASLLTLFVFTVMWFVEERLEEKLRIYAAKKPTTIVNTKEASAEADG